MKHILPLVNIITKREQSRLQSEGRLNTIKHFYIDVLILCPKL